MLDILSFPVSIVGFTVVEPAEIFKMKVLRRLTNAILMLVFANIALHERAMLIIFYAVFTENMLNTFSYPESTI